MSVWCAVILGISIIVCACVIALGRVLEILIKHDYETNDYMAHRETKSGEDKTIKGFYNN